MKLRIRGNSVRLRLTRSEVAAVGDGGSVAESTAFPNGTRLTYVLRPGSGAMSAEFDGNRLVVVVPAAEAQSWARSERVSLAGEQVAGDATLTLLVEKDFECLAPRDGEDNPDAFPNPNAD